MANNPKKIRDLALNGSGRLITTTAFLEFKNLLMNNLKIERTDDVPLMANTETYIKSTLLEDGCIGYDCITQKFASVKGTGVNEEGNPTDLIFAFANGKTFTRKAFYEPNPVGAYIINATPVIFSLSKMIRQTTDFMNECDIAIKQNVNASKNPAFFVLKNIDMQLSLKQAILQQQSGEPVVIVSDELGEAVKGVATNYTFIADKIDELKQKYRDRLFNKLGIMSANIDKKERVQVGEVNATTGQCVDYIYLLIDTFNNYCNSYELPFKMRFNGSLEELYEDDTIEEPTNEETKEGEANEQQ